MKRPIPLAPESFLPFGFFVRRGFLSPAACARLRRAMSAADAVSGQIRSRGRSVRSRGDRRVDVVTVSSRMRAGVDRAFRRVMPLLQARFGRRLSGLEPVQFLRYRRGGRYVLHTDRTPGSRDAVAGRRKVSLIVFLSPPADHLGGALVFPAMRSGDRRARLPLAVRAEAGLLVAFRPEIEHEVRPVRRGVRCTLATWCF